MRTKSSTKNNILATGAAVAVAASYGGDSSSSAGNGCSNRSVATAAGKIWQWAAVATVAALLSRAAPFTELKVSEREIKSSIQLRVGNMRRTVTTTQWQKQNNNREWKLQQHQLAAIVNNNNNNNK